MVRFQEEGQLISPTIRREEIGASRVVRWRRHVPRDWFAYGEEMQRELRQDFCFRNSERRSQLGHKAGPS